MRFNWKHVWGMDAIFQKRTINQVIKKSNSGKLQMMSKIRYFIMIYID